MTLRDPDPSEDSAAPETMGASMSPKKTTIIGLARQGYTPAEISRRVGERRGTVSRTLNQARRDGIEVPIFGNSGVILLESEWTALNHAAVKYGTDAKRLAHMIISIVIRDGLFSAVIDDEQIDNLQNTCGNS